MNGMGPVLADPELPNKLLILGAQHRICQAARAGVPVCRGFPSRAYVLGPELTNSEGSAHAEGRFTRGVVWHRDDPTNNFGSVSGSGSSNPAFSGGLCLGRHFFTYKEDVP